jgi:membrane protein required for colicin V production
MIVDTCFIILMVLAIFKGYSRGFIVALFSIFAFIAGLAAAMKLSTVVANYLGNNAGITKQWLPVISFLLVFIVVALLVRLGASVIEKTMQLAMLGWVNRIAGIILYVVLYVVLLSVLIFYAIQVKMISDATLASSVTWPYLQPWGPLAMNGLGKLLPFFKDMFAQLQSFFENISHKVS